MGITKIQKEVFDFIYDYTKEFNYPPTQREIKDHFEFKSFGSVQKYLKYLEDFGYLETNWNERRGLKLLKNKTEKSIIPVHTELSTVTIPLLGNIAAGDPILALENPNDSIDIPKSMIPFGKKGNFFALKVKGDSMIEAGILENDIVICLQKNQANNGEIVVALHNGEATLKEYHQLSSTIELRPKNQRLKPIIIADGDFNIAGVLIGLFRTY
jgi:repressor LexA